MHSLFKDESSSFPQGGRVPVAPRGVETKVPEHPQDAEGQAPGHTGQPSHRVRPPDAPHVRV